MRKYYLFYRANYYFTTYYYGGVSFLNINAIGGQPTSTKFLTHILGNILIRIILMEGYIEDQIDPEGKIYEGKREIKNLLS